jgi:predicted ThiF/HesA family dinucleotide-utilizing enzyme
MRLGTEIYLNRVEFIKSLAKVLFATEVTEKKRVLRGFPQIALCALWLLM